MERVELNFVGCWLAYGRRYALVTLLEDPPDPAVPRGDGDSSGCSINAIK